MLQQAILQTIAYFDIHEYPLTIEELQLFLWREKTSSTEIIIALQTMPQLGGKEGFVFLQGRQELVAKRKQKQIIANELWLKTHRYLHYLCYLPFIKMVAVANNVAFNNPHPDSDIDLLIVTDKNRLWLSRLLITGLLHILGVRRHGTKIRHRFCLSFFLTTEALNLQPLTIDEEDIYLIYWIATLKPVIDNNLYKLFIQENQALLAKFLPNYDLNRINYDNKIIPLSTFAKIFSNISHWFLSGYLGNLIEQAIKTVLAPRTRNKAKKLGSEANIIISDQMLKFHNIDRRQDFKQKWINNLRQIEQLS
jgi:hypothetical protein